MHGEGEYKKGLRSAMIIKFGMKPEDYGKPMEKGKPEAEESAEAPEQEMEPMASGVSEEEIKASADKLAQTDPEDFKSYPKGTSVMLNAEDFPSLAEEKPGSPVMLAVKGKLASNEEGKLEIDLDSTALLHGNMGYPDEHKKNLKSSLGGKY